MVNPIDFGGHSSKVKVTMFIIDKCGVRGDATLCVVIFIKVCLQSRKTFLLLYCLFFIFIIIIFLFLSHYLRSAVSLSFYIGSFSYLAS